MSFTNTTSGVLRPKTCAVCRNPMPPQSTGRPRQTCSDACRQKRYRRRRQDDREWNKKSRWADRVIRRWEKKYGSFDYPDNPEFPRLTFRFRLHFRLTRYIDIPECLRCGKPFLQETANGVVMKCCSRYCTGVLAKEKREVLQSLEAQPERAHPLTKIHLQFGGRCRVCKHCQGAFPLYYPHKKYCSAKCRSAAWRKHHPKRTCKDCGEPYRASLGHAKRQKYCSFDCRNRRTSRERYHREHPNARRLDARRNLVRHAHEAATGKPQPG